MANPLSPEDEARVRAYYGGAPQPAPAAGPIIELDADPAKHAPVDMGDIDSYSPVIELDQPAAPAPFAAGATKMGIGPPQGEKVYNDFDPSQIRGMSLAEPPRGLQLAPKPPPPVAPPTGPSAADNAAFEAFKASQARTAPRPAIAGGGPAAKPNPDPFGIKAAGDKAVASYDTQADATRSLGEHEALKATNLGALQAEQARRRIEDADLEARHADIASKRLDDSILETQRQLDDVRAKKIKPMLGMDAGPATGLISIIGGVFGGLYQGVKGLDKNPFLDEMNRMVDRQIAVDEKNVANEREALQGKMNLLQQQRAIYHDDQTARLAAKNLYYEAFKEQLAGEAQQQDSPMYKDRAASAIAELNRGQGLLQKQLGEQLRSQAMAGAASALARQKEVIEAYRTTYDKALSAGYSPAIAEAEARRMIGVLYNGQGGTPRPPEQADAMGGMTKEQRGKIVSERYESQTASDEFNSQLDALKKSPAVLSDTISSGTLSKLGSRMAPESSKYVQDLHQINIQMLQAVGKVAKDADGKPNQHMIAEIKETYGLEPSDSPAMKMQKLEGARAAVNSLARQQGALGAPKPSAAQDRADAVGFKPGVR